MGAGKGTVVASPAAARGSAAVAGSPKVDVGASEALAGLTSGEESGGSKDDSGELHFDGIKVLY